MIFYVDYFNEDRTESKKTFRGLVWLNEQLPTSPDGSENAFLLFHNFDSELFCDSSIL